MGDSIPPSTTAAIFQNPQVLASIQAQLGNLIGTPSGYIQSLPEEVQRRIHALQNLNDKHNEINNKFQEEYAELERKYSKIHQPLYDKRLSIITGAYEPNEEECHREKAKDEENDDHPIVNEKKENGDQPLKGIPQFWLTALRTHPEIDELVVGEKDEEALQYLIDIKSIFLDDNPGFRLEFVFSENPFFKDQTLTKTYYLQRSEKGQLEFDRAEASEIHWNEGQDFTVKVEIKKQRNKNTHNTRTVKRTVPTETFFNFFKPPQAPKNPDVEENEALRELGAKIESDYEAGEIIKEAIIPHAIEWFTGMALLDYDDSESGYDDDEYDEDGEGDDDE